MEPTVALKKRLRKMINDIVPPRGSDEDAIFSDVELDDLLKESENIYQAAAEAWTIKAGLLQGEIESYSAGNEKYDLTPLKDRLQHALSMGRMYEDKAASLEIEEPQGSFMLKFKSPDVI